MQYIAKFYNEDPESYTNEIYNLESLRESAVRPTTDVAGVQTLKKYYCQLHFLKSRFPMEDSQPVVVYFSWKNPLTNVACSVRDIRFEQMCILYNIGALHTQLGALESRNSPDGMKMACTHFQCAAWAFKTVKENYYEFVTLLETIPLIHFWEQVCLAQAQECILEKSMLDNRKATIIAKVSVQVEDYYRRSLNMLQTNTSTMPLLIGIKIVKDWIKYLNFKGAYHRSISLLFQGQQAEEQQKMGERVAFYQAASEQLEESRKLASQIKNSEIPEALAFTSDVIEGKRKAAKNENEFIYHEEVPDKEALQEVKGASLVKGIPFSVNDLEVSGPDLFGRLVPMEAHEASSLYSEKKAELLRRIGDLIDTKDQAVAEFTSSMQLEFLTKMKQASGIPQDLIDRAAALSARPTAAQDLIDAMNKLSTIYNTVEGMLNEIDGLLKAEEENEKKFQDVMGPRPPSIIATDLARESAKYREAHTKANDSNQTLQKAMTTHVANLKILSTPLRQLHKQLPSIELPNPNINEQQLKELEGLVAKVEEMRTQRAMLWAQYREAVHNDDITGVLVTKQPDESLDELFDKELEKHHNLQNLIEQNAAAQENIRQALVDAYANAMPTRRYIHETIQKRNQTIAALITSYDTYDDLLAKAKKGIEFYTKLETNVSKLLQRIKSASKVQQEERDQLLNNTTKEKVEQQNIPTPSTTPKLKDYLESRKKNINANQPVNYPPVSYQQVPEMQSWPPAVRPAPLGSEMNDPVGLAKSGAQEAQYAYYAQYQQPQQPIMQETFNKKDDLTNNSVISHTNPMYNYNNYIPMTGYNVQPKEIPTKDDLTDRMSNLALSKPDSYSNYIPQNYAASSYNVQPNVAHTTPQEIIYDPSKAFTTTTSTYQTISSPLASTNTAQYAYIPTTYQSVNTPSSMPQTSYVQQDYPVANYPVNSQQENFYQYPQTTQINYIQPTDNNVYYPQGYAPNYSTPNSVQSTDSTEYHTLQYASSVGYNPTVTFSYNSTYTSPLANTSSSSTVDQQYMSTSTNNPQQVAYTSASYYPQTTQISSTTGFSPETYDPNQAYAFNYTNYYNQTYNSGNYVVPTSTQVETKPVVTKESNIDLLSGLDFSISQAPLVPQQNTEIKQETKAIVTSESTTKVETKPIKPDVPKQIITTKILSSKPLINNDVKELFNQEVNKFEKYVDTLTNKTLSGPTNLDLKWKEIQDKQDCDGQKRVISVARCYPMKNRFPDILPYDFSRVELSDNEHDYINASYVKDVSLYAPVFIVAQSPLQSTIADFWTMIREQQVELIFCVLNDNEVNIVTEYL